MEELNTTETVDLIEQQGYDTLTVVDLGDTIALSQLDEDGNLHNIILSTDQAARLASILGRILG